MARCGIPTCSRVRRVIEACDRNGAVVILGCYYQRQDQVLQDEAAVRAGVVNVVKWIKDSGFTNVVLEIANEFGHSGFDHRLLKTPEGIAELIGLAKQTAPDAAGVRQRLGRWPAGRRAWPRRAISCWSTSTPPASKTFPRASPP